VATRQRVVSAVVFVPILIILSRIGGLPFLFLVLAILIAASSEFYRLMEAKGVHPSKKTGIVAGAVLCVLAYWRGTEPIGLFLSGFVVWTMLRELFRSKVAFPIHDIATTLFGVLYVGWLTTYFVLLRELPAEIGAPYQVGSALLLYVFLMSWGCDSGAYFVGTAFGKHKLFPRVSPKKSVQGAAAGFVASVAMAYVGRAWFVRDAAGNPLLGPGETAALGALVGVFTQLGDLAESLLKRDAAVKDASQLVPGHGGVMDIFDGLLFSAPVAYYFLTFVAFR
jgi:phosphatidate cytidylyltransferase